MNPYKKSESRGRLKPGLKDKEENPDKMSKKNSIIYIYLSTGEKHGENLKELQKIKSSKYRHR